ncbi:hypothetical protein [Brevibacillus laterosporus]|uniref:hypothetical protein n=1 Tax=Brevibacillus laterosporus TaxID=1465 RepID=UPI000E6B6E5C|nr:hypothetical protein [Brevibacillus laterosporus]AYB37637.1 hypothetical protein D5F52_04690 [Brevibacillus laterosporus]MBM7110883.1 hypothetical protein [Brevibacillus laterosporus]
MSKKGSAWKAYKREMRDFYSLENLLMGLLGSIIVNLISSYTGYSVVSIIVVSTLGLTLLFILATSIILIKNKIKK